MLTRKLLEQEGFDVDEVDDGKQVNTDVSYLASFHDVDFTLVLACPETRST